MREIRYILILVIGGVLFWVGTGLLASQLIQLGPPPSGWRAVTGKGGRRSMNLTTSTFNITGEKWEVSWSANPRELSNASGIRFFVEVYNASTNEKLQEFTFSGNFTKWYGWKELNTTGSFYLKIQVSAGDTAWSVRVWEYKPPPRFPAWIMWVAAVGITGSAIFFAYKKLKARTRQTSSSIPSDFVALWKSSHKP